MTFIEGYKNDSYTVMDQTITDSTYHDKPGIGVVTTLRFKNNAALMATGGFDHRIKLVSLKTLKQLIDLRFHQDIVNNIILEKITDSKINLYSSSEDGYVACWKLDI